MVMPGFRMKMRQSLLKATDQELKRYMRQSLDYDVRKMAYGILVNRRAFIRRP